MNRKIFYVDSYYKEEKERNIGFVKLEEDGLFVMLRGVQLRGNTVCKVYAVKEDGDRKFLADIGLENGYGQATIRWPEQVKAEKCREIYIPIDQMRYGKCLIESPKEQTKQQEVKQSKIQVFQKKQEPIQNTIGKTEKKPTIEPIAEAMPVMEQDKWKQLCNIYPQVHIFPEADTVVIKPKDMVVLTQDYHELATNSFVVHAYYNYRQLLLLRYHQGTEITYYLGVPGVYYEREKRIALMFGFEGFENGESRLVNEDRRQAYAGCFGYYMKQVRI